MAAETEQIRDKDLLRGVPAIAAHLGLDERPCRHLCETGKIPVFKLGGIIHARRSSLKAHFDALERAALGAAPEHATLTTNQETADNG